ncbi:hypothetical protein [Streptomyces cucumeris]|uniref:hypothetical protein n=1 Tax=Streptomyces cucumeris TaxID=2962890 RepID=UPI003EBD092E
MRQLQAEGMDIAPDLAQVSPYLTEHIRRFGEYSTHELGDEPATEGSRRPREPVSRVGGRHITAPPDRA